MKFNKKAVYEVNKKQQQFEFHELLNSVNEIMHEANTFRKNNQNVIQSKKIVYSSLNYLMENIESIFLLIHETNFELHFYTRLEIATRAERRIQIVTVLLKIIFVLTPANKQVSVLTWQNEQFFQEVFQTFIFLQIAKSIRYESSNL